MTIQEKITQDLRGAMLSKNEFKKSILRVIIGEFNRIDKTVDDTKATAILKKMVENAVINKNDPEVFLISQYLPQQLSLDQLTVIVGDLITTKGYATLKDMGKVMADLKGGYAGQYDGKVANEIVKQKLA